MAGGVATIRHALGGLILTLDALAVVTIVAVVVVLLGLLAEPEVVEWDAVGTVLVCGVASSVVGRGTDG